MNNRSILPLEAIHKLMVEKVAVDVWMEKESVSGRIVGLDEYMNLVLDQDGSRLIIKGECIFSIVPRSFREIE